MSSYCANTQEIEFMDTSEEQQTAIMDSRKEFLKNLEDILSRKLSGHRHFLLGEGVFVMHLECLRDTYDWVG